MTGSIRYLLLINLVMSYAVLSYTLPEFDVLGCVECVEGGSILGFDMRFLGDPRHIHRKNNAIDFRRPSSCLSRGCDLVNFVQPGGFVGVVYLDFNLVGFVTTSFDDFGVYHSPSGGVFLFRVHILVFPDVGTAFVATVVRIVAAEVLQIAVAAARMNCV